jgi:transcriptional regulator with XRE-family HTH domain
VTARERFGKKLKQLRREKSAREERDVPQSEVATFVGDTQPNVAKWEGGRFPDDEDTIRRLAAYYNVNYAWLRLDEGPREPLPAERTSPARERTVAKRPAAGPKRQTGS